MIFPGSDFVIKDYIFNKKGENKKSSDFRYDTGETKVLWTAVGELVNNKDILEIIRFLIQPGKNKKEFQT